MDEEGGDDRGRNQEPTGPAMGPLYESWENSLDKLKILNYEKSFCATKNRSPFNRVYFVFPMKNQSHQFDDFVELCSWLCTEITRNADTFKRDPYDDPTTVANKLLLALRGLDYRVAFPSQKLKTPYGESVINVIEFLVEKALQAKGFKFQQPIYMDSDEGQQADMEDADDDVIEDEVIAEPEEDDSDDIARSDPIESSLDQSSHQIIQGQIDPIAWKTELERVAPTLKSQMTVSTNEWRSHVDQTIVSKGQIDKLLGDTNNDIQKMDRLVSDELMRLKTKEKYINNQFTSLISEFQEVKKRMEEFESKSGKSNEKVTKLTNELAELSEKLEELKESFESKDSGINDTSPLVRIKAALQQIKTEIKAFDLRIGVVSHSLLASKVMIANRKRYQAAQKSRRRRNRSKKDDDDSILSGEEDT